MFLITGVRRKRLMNRPFPLLWEKALENVPLYKRLPEEDRRELKGLIQVFLAEKNFEGCGGFVITDEVRLPIAAQACILLLHRKPRFYPGLSSIIIYPDEYCAPFRDVDESGVVTEWTDRLSGESRQEGSIVLSWKDVTGEGLKLREAYNVVLHEFAHQLDAEDGITAGARLAEDAGQSCAMFEILEQAHRRLRYDVRRGRVTALDPYGEESLEEFFAVATELFFERPTALRVWDSGLFAGLVRYYRQNPAEWGGTSPVETG